MEALLLVVVLIGSVVVHEVAHAWQARREGDDTAEKLGRITLNPLPHLDLFGSFIVPLALYATNSGFLFGWAKPVPVDPRNYREYVAGDIRVSLAGIVSNLILAVIATLLMAFVVWLQGRVGNLGVAGDFVFQGLNYMLWINLILAFFNLIPIPPLDGSHVLAHLLPEGLQHQYRLMGQYGILILMGIMFLFEDVFGLLLWPVNYLTGLADWFIRLWI